MKTLLLIAVLALTELSVFSQTNTAAYDQLMTLAGTFINNGNLDAAKQTAQQVLQLDSQNWRGNALMAAILQKQGDFTNAQIYIQKAITAAPADKMAKLNEMVKTITASATQSAPTQSTEPTAEETIAWMRKHLGDLSCDIRVSPPAGPTYTFTRGKRNFNGSHSDTYVLKPISISVTNNLLVLSMFELCSTRCSGIETNGQNSSVISKKHSSARIHTLFLNLRHISMAVSETSQLYEWDGFFFGWPYLSQAETPTVTMINGEFILTNLEEGLSSPSTKYEGHKLCPLIIYAGSDTGISDSVAYAGIASERRDATKTLISISDHNWIHTYDYANVPTQLSDPPAFWVDPNQDDNNPGAIEDWILKNCEKKLPAGDQDTPNGLLYPTSIAIFSTNENALEQWRNAIARLAALSGSHYYQLLNQAGRQIEDDNLDAVAKTALELIQMDGHRWEGNALMGWVLDRQGNINEGSGYLSAFRDNEPKPPPFMSWSGPNGIWTIKREEVQAFIPISSDPN